MVEATGSTSKQISTGNTELDKKLGGGIPGGSLTFIEGASDSGKSVLSQQLIWGSLKNDCRVTLLTTENTVKSFIRQTDSLNLNVLDNCLLGRFRVYPIKASRAKNGTGKALEALIDAVYTQRDQDMVVVDSLTSFITQASTDDVIAFFEECKSLCNADMSIVLVFHTYAFEPSLLVRLSSLCDAHLRLSTEIMGTKLMKILEVCKIRGAQKATGDVASFDVEPGWGMRIIPFSKARA